MVRIFVDGASAGNPGYAGAGIFVQPDEGENEFISIPLGTMTNHEAEFAAVLEALKLCETRDWNIISINTDSKLVDEAVEKRHTKKSMFRPYLLEILNRMDSSELCFLKWIPSKQNRAADKLAKQAIQEYTKRNEMESEGKRGNNSF
ncbi:reverse transcriptase-like protein [Alteribacillus iranensis]|uniref:RNase HI n=1 Tax=Alteribacillus iranensis TaxID=930128 RepID=A0A1I2A1V2_9BACI|nr:reverse transcriptase-like protein [Alteribacillus iranensis]SFE36700.1 RNase HI [Alteribacillus iranensis]